MDVGQLLRPLIDQAGSPPTVDALRQRARRRRRRRWALGGAGLCLGVLAGVAVAARTGPAELRVTTDPNQSLPAPPVPAGWQAVTFGGVQFSVPGGWPVYGDGR